MTEQFLSNMILTSTTKCETRRDQLLLCTCHKWHFKTYVIRKFIGLYYMMWLT